jgi:hypothetical protein
MTVSSETLFHFTNSLGNIKKILSKKFQITYCKEEYHLNEVNRKNHFPMVSFCDLPLSLAKNHIKQYGNYAIGLSKTWGINNRLNPVTYVERNSLVARDLEIGLNEIDNFFLKIENTLNDKGVNDNINELINESDLLFMSLLNIRRYIKNYKGDLVRKNKTILNYKFYNEREWRYVPEWNNPNIKFRLTTKEYAEFRGNPKKSKPFLDNFSLNFNASDINYIIVKSDKDIPKLISFIHGTKGLTQNIDEVDVLTTKILTVEQLNQDF